MTNNRALVRLLPAILAIALQIILPVSMVHAMGAALDPLDHAVICLAGTAQNGADAEPGAPPHQHMVCPVCHVAAATPAAIIPQLLAEPAPSAGPTIAPADPAQSAGPRGPPSYRPGARAPPLHS